MALSDFGPKDTATAIAQHLLDSTGVALMGGSYDTFRRYFALPTSVATPTGARDITTEADLRDLFDGVSRYYRGLGDIVLDRPVQHALFDGDDRIRYDHVTTITRDGAVIFGPIASHSVAERRADGWQVVASHYVLSPDAPQATTLVPPESDPGPPSDEAEALAIFQANLDMITRAYLKGDFDLLSAHIMTPLFKQGSQQSEVVTDAQALREEFDRFQTAFRIHGVTDLVRGVKRAHFIGDGRIFGSYRTHILSGTRLAIPSYVSAATLERGKDGVWRMTSIMHPLQARTLDGTGSTPFTQ